MDFAAYLDAVTSDALGIIATFDRGTARSGRLKTQALRELESLHRVYFGRTKFSKQQRIAQEAARAGGFSLDELALIEKHLSPIDDPSTLWHLRHELLRTKGGYEDLLRRVKEVVPKERAKPSKGARFSRSVDGMRTMTVTEEERTIADLEHALRSQTDPHSNEPISSQMADAFVNLMRGNADDDCSVSSSARSGVPYAAPRPLLLIPLDQHTRILDGDGDDVVLGLTDGTTMTGAEYLQRFHSGDAGAAGAAGAYGSLEAALFHPTEGPVNLYEAARFPNDKMRDLLRAAMPVCPVPDCKQTADYCEFHHITPWKHGGHTNLANLTPLCRYHNRTNDDDPHIVKRGKITTVSGTPMWQSPRGYLVPNDSHDSYRFSAMWALFGDPRKRRTTADP